MQLSDICNSDCMIDISESSLLEIFFSILSLGISIIVVFTNL